MNEKLELIRTPSAIDLFRFSAVTWNAHRIHYDEAHAKSEGLPGSVVQAHLHGAYLGQAALAWGGAGSRLRELSWRNKAPAVAGETLRIELSLVGIRTDDQRRLADVSLQEFDSRGTCCVEGTAVVELPPTFAGVNS
jgi:hydroxyacyl-ACP dehydratase HTD2-like protein with hotdog domain